MLKTLAAIVSAPSVGKGGHIFARVSIYETYALMWGKNTCGMDIYRSTYTTEQQKVKQKIK
jgi:hypothetical protein